MASQSKTEKMADQVEALINQFGYDLVDLEYVPRSKQIRVFIDHLETEASDKGAKSTITLEDCVRVDRCIGEMIEADPDYPEEITLEVSSPGVNRALKKEKDFKRFKGERISVNTFRPLRAEELDTQIKVSAKGQKKFQGILQGLDESSSKVILELDGGRVSIPRELIAKAHIDFEF